MVFRLVKILSQFAVIFAAVNLVSHGSIHWDTSNAITLQNMFNGAMKSNKLRGAP